MVEMDEIEVKEKVPEKESKVLLVLTLLVDPVVVGEAVVSWWQLAFSFLLHRLDRRRLNQSLLLAKQSLGIQGSSYVEA